MGNLLDAPKTEKDELDFTSSTGLKGGISAMQGWRLEMEDAHICRDMPSKKDHMLVAVFDGHGGSGTAIFAAEHLTDVIEKSPQWNKYLESNCENIKMLADAFQQSFLKIDEQIKLKQDQDPQDQSGCTAVVCMVTPVLIMCSNAGDSRCVISSNETALNMSEDHKPDDHVEKTRIVNAGGCVQMGRVEGNLAVSRAFGDFEYKDKHKLPAEEQKVSAFPDIFIHYRNTKDNFLLLACDGLWDVMGNKDGVKAVVNIQNHYKQEHSEKAPLSKVASAMVDKALEEGSKDNISVVLVDLEGNTTTDCAPAAHENALPSKYGRHDYPKDSYGAMPMGNI